MAGVGVDMAGVRLVLRVQVQVVVAVDVGGH